MSQIPKRRHAPSNLTLSPAMEDYLKAVYKLTRDQDSASTQDLADKLGVSPASTTKMIKRLAESSLVVHEPYQGVALTETGHKIAVEIVRHHRLLELYLTQALGFTWDEVHEEAELLEHYISEKLEAKISDYLGNPTFDPHGSPIPTLDGEIPRGGQIPVVLVEPGRPYQITRVHTQDSILLQQLEALSLVPGVAIVVFGRPPGSKFHLKVGRQEILVAPELCELVSCGHAEEECFPATQLVSGESARVTKLRGSLAERSGLETGASLTREGEEYACNGRRFSHQQAAFILVTPHT